MPSVRDFEYQSGDLVMRGRLAVPDGDGPFPAVLIAHEANGLDEFQRQRAEHYCDLGYVALALDYHGGGKVFTQSEAPEMMQQLEVLGSDPDEIRRRGQAGLDALLSQPTVDPAKVAAVGYCFGETVAMELARTGADLKAVVGFHPGLNILRPGESRHIRGKVLMCIGADDPVVSAEQRAAFEEEMRSAGVDWRMHLYGGVQHSFTHPNSGTYGLPGLKYDERAAARSWRAMTDVLEEVF